MRKKQVSYKLTFAMLTVAPSVENLAALRLLAANQSTNQNLHRHRLFAISDIIVTNLLQRGKLLNLVLRRGQFMLLQELHNRLFAAPQILRSPRNSRPKNPSVLHSPLISFGSRNITSGRKSGVLDLAALTGMLSPATMRPISHPE